MINISLNIYRGLGVLSTGKLVECTRSDIVGEFQGQTAQKMKAKIRETTAVKYLNRLCEIEAIYKDENVQITKYYLKVNANSKK